MLPFPHKGHPLQRACQEGSFRKLKYTIGLSNFHAYKPEYMKQKIWAKLIAYNMTEALIGHTVIKQSHRYL